MLLLRWPLGMRVTALQRRFIDEYMVDLNGAQAAVRAGYAAGSARYSAARNLARKDIKAEVAARIADRATRVKVTADQVIKELARLAFVDPSRIMSYSRGRIRLSETDSLSEDDRRCVEELSESVGGGVKVRLASKVKALELLGRHLGLFVDRMEHSGPDGGPIRATVDMSDEELEAIAGGG